MTITTRTRTARARLAAVVGGLAAIATLGLTAPAATAAPDDGAAPVQVEVVTSDEQVTVEAARATAAAGTLYCAVIDGTFGCKDYPVGTGLVVARLYDGASFTGRQVVVYNPRYRVGCTGSTTDNEGGSTLGAMSNRVSSVRTYHQCDVKLFDGASKDGASTGWIDINSRLGSLDNRASSFAIS
ncbi:hypothetical protein M1843_01895 [Isoptericola sp. 4D.3]|uniref:Uncharacterized protein n=1 Tax=Isoptericola peretonis TaxID=2918523 RepID=A0ABT0IZ72_9MICO|nr:hypothetical protein [Isoptericola sp. 4D.3]